MGGGALYRVSSVASPCLADALDQLARYGSGTTSSHGDCTAAKSDLAEADKVLVTVKGQMTQLGSMPYLRKTEAREKTCSW